MSNKNNKLKNHPNLQKRDISFLTENPSWEKMYFVYKDFFERHQAQSISSKYIDDNGNPIGSWFRYQRQRKLPAGIAGLMSDVNANWNTKKEKNMSTGDRSMQWEQKLALVEEYKKEVGENIPSRTIYKNENIGYWLNRQKSSYEKGRLDESQIARLEKLGVKLR